MGKNKIYDENGNLVKETIKKPFYKRFWFWILTVFLISFISSLESTEKETEAESINTVGETANEYTAEKTTKHGVSGRETEAEEDAEVSTGNTITEPGIKEAKVEKEEKEITILEPDTEELYQDILDDYTEKLKEATPKLVEEYNVEYPSNTQGLDGLAELSNDKISELAEISNDGISEMANIHLTNGSGQYEEYEEWAGKLTDVYMDEAEKLTDAYMNSAQ